MNWPFTWNSGIARIRCRTSSSVTVMPSRLGLGHHRLLVDQLLQDLLLEAQLFQQLLADVGAVRLPVRGDLALIGGPELQDADAPAVHLRDLVAREGAVTGSFARRKSGM